MRAGQEANEQHLDYIYTTICAVHLYRITPKKTGNTQARHAWMMTTSTIRRCTENKMKP